MQRKQKLKGYAEPSDDSAKDRIQSAVSELCAAAISAKPYKRSKDILHQDVTISLPDLRAGTTIMLLREEAPENGGTIIFHANDNRTFVRALNTVNIANVSDVDSVRGRISGRSLIATARGIVPTFGWTAASLLPVMYIVDPADGIFEFSFVAERPNGVTAQVVTSIETEEFAIDISKHMKGIRFKALRNEYTLRLLQYRAGSLPDSIDEVAIQGGSYENHSLHVQVQRAGGGKNRHDFEIIWNGAYTQSDPPVAHFRLLHNGNGDEGVDLLRDTLHFALPDLSPCILHIDNGTGGAVDVPYRI